MARLPRSVRMLLLCSLAITISRATALPFLAIYLAKRLQLDQQQVGWMLGASILLGTLCGLYGGHLVDRFDKRRLVALAIGMAAASFVLTPLLGGALTVLLVLSASDGAFSLVDIALKALLAELLPPEQRAKAFSARYTLVNAGWALGPLLGALVAAYDPLWPFWLAALLAMVSLLGFGGWSLAFPSDSSATASAQAAPDFAATLRVLKNDRRLVWFTLGGLLSAIVYARFSTYLSQYLVVTATQQRAYEVVSALIVSNGLAVVALQYWLGKQIKQVHLMRWIVAGSLLFALGLLGFMHALSLAAWVLAMVVFTLGEITVVPAEYLFIDHIAPSHLRGSYYGAQNLANLGGALSPVLCGLLLSQAAPALMFYVLMALAVSGAGMYYLGYRCMRQMAAGQLQTLARV